MLHHFPVRSEWLYVFICVFLTPSFIRPIHLSLAERRAETKFTIIRCRCHCGEARTDIINVIEMGNYVPSLSEEDGHVPLFMCF